MEEGELCHDQCMILPLDGRMQDIGTAKPNARSAMCMDLSPGFSDFEYGVARCISVPYYLT